MTLADSHIHLFENGYPGRYGRLFPKGGEVKLYEAFRAEHKIERALVVGYEGEPWCQGNNACVARLADKHSWIAPLAFCSTTQPLQTNSLVEQWDAGFFGISLYVFDEHSAHPLLEAPSGWLDFLNEKKAILSVNCPPAFARVLRTVWKALPETRILFSHLGLPGRADSEDEGRKLLANLQPLLELAELPNVGVKLSGFYACNPYPHDGIRPLLRELAASFGTERLYWGSDFSPALDHVSFAQAVCSADQLLPGEVSRPRIHSANLLDALKRVHTAARRTT